MFKLDNFGVILFVSFNYKNYNNVHFMKIQKINAKMEKFSIFLWNFDFCWEILFFSRKLDSTKNSKQFVYYNENMYTNSNFQMQFSRKLQRFRGCRKNKKCSIFHELYEYQQTWYSCLFPLDFFHFSHWTCPLRKEKIQRKVNSSVH